MKLDLVENMQILTCSIYWCPKC